MEVFDGEQTGGTVSIYYENGCSDAIQMIPVAIRNGVPTNLPAISIAPGNTRSFTTINLVALRVLCTSANPQGNCRGKYCINYHYDVLAI
nr:S-Ena type endospore appendage [Bacillus infantis]